MFTGLIEEVGTIESITPTGDGAELVLKGAKVMDDIDVDDSIAVNGCCLTVTSFTDNTFSVTAVAETLKKTTLGDLTVGSMVNLERAMQLGARLGGHIVQGHVDTTGVVEEVIQNDTGWEVWFSFPPQYRKYLIPVGTLCINGVSLTVAEVEEERLKVALIPHTLDVSNLIQLKAGDRVNLEFDLLAKYVENFTGRT